MAKKEELKKEESKIEKTECVECTPGIRKGKSQKFPGRPE